MGHESVGEMGDNWVLVTYDPLLFPPVQYFATFIICFVARKGISADSLLVMSL